MDLVLDKGIFWHGVTTSLFQGGAIVMALAIAARLVSFRDWYVRGVNMRLANGTAVALLSVWNLVFAIAGGLTGLWLTWGFEATTSLSLTVNKTMFGSFALLSLVLMLWLQFRYGPGLWDSGSLKTSYAILGMLVAAVAVLNGSLGGEASLVGTILEPAWDFLGIVVRYPIVLPKVGGMILVAAALAVIASAVVAALMRRRASS